MQKALLVTEKPSVTKVIQETYNKNRDKIPYDIDFVSAAGHLIGLCDPDEYRDEWGTPWKAEVLPMIPDKWKKKIINSKFYSNIKETWENGNYDIIINAGDAGREGQLIQHLIYDMIGVNVPIMRLWINDTTSETILKSFSLMKSDDVYKGLTDASYLRLYFDWLCGMNFSRAASLSLDRTARIGRVMTASLALVVNRELEIRNFTPKKYYELEAIFKLPSGDKYKGYFMNTSGDKTLPSEFAFWEKKTLSAIVRDMEKTGSVKEVKKQEKRFSAPMLYNLTELQKDSSTKYGISPSTTLEVAQSLYEKGFLSYPRTESKHITTEQTEDVISYLEKLENDTSNLTELATFAKTALADRQRVTAVLKDTKYVNNKKVQDHPALLPTGIPDKSSLSVNELCIYTLVAKRLIAIFYPESVLATTTIITKTDGFQELNFKTTGTVQIEAGWRVLSDTKKSNEKELPAADEADPVTLVSANILDKETVSSKRYSDATLLAAMETAGKLLDDKELEKVLMESAGLGTAATRAEILNKLFKYGYCVYNKKKMIEATDEGIQLITALSGHTIISAEFTAKWEKKLKEVEKGELSYDAFYNFMCVYVQNETKELLTLKKLGRYSKEIGKCPVCGKPFLFVGSFYCCLGYLERETGSENKKCSFALPKKYGGRELTDTDIQTLLMGKETKAYSFKWQNGTSSVTSLILEKDENGKFTGKIAFPPPKSFGKCPLCNGNILRGKKGWYCENAAKNDGEGKRMCSFSVFGSLGKTNITNEQAMEVFNNGETKDEVRITWQSGKKFSGKIILDTYDNGYTFKIKPFDKKDLCSCPFCVNGTIFEEQFYYRCSNLPPNGTCDMQISKTFCGYKISPADAKKLIKGETLRRRLCFKKGSWESDFHIERDSEKGCILSFVSKKQ